jgi:hypothetical protein
VTGADEVRAVLEPVYAALGLEWDPATTGAVEDVAPGVTASDAVEALRAAFATIHDLVPAELDAATRERADALAPAHDAEAPVAQGPGAEKILAEPA